MRNFHCDNFRSSESEALMRRLQEWYLLVNGVYLDRNFYRSTESIFAHLVEVTRGLGVAASRRRKRELDAEEFLPKSLAWWLALCGRAGVPDVEEMLWAKFPRACPYCKRAQHEGKFCKEANPTTRNIDWPALRQRGSEQSRPNSLADWQKMFNDVYPRDDSTSHETNVNRLAEELGEMAEAVRTLPVAPQYFLAEAPDVFAWLMGFANQFAFDRQEPLSDYGVSLTSQMEKEYPGYCILCSKSVCKCPPIPSSTLGRIAQEASFDSVRLGRLFTLQESMECFSRAEEEFLIGSESVLVTGEEIKQILDDTGRILGELAKQTLSDSSVTVGLAAALGGIRYLALQGELTQGAVEDVMALIKDMPNEARQHVLGFLNNLSASGTFSAIAQVMGMAG